MTIHLGPSKNALETSKWAKIMTKVAITNSTKEGRRWRIVSFEGQKGGESRGIVDMLAIRKNHNFSNKRIKIGDLFDVILIQAKGGASKFPTKTDKQRLDRVKSYYRAKAIILANWKKSKMPTFYKLVGYSWKESEASDVFA